MKNLHIICGDSAGAALKTALVQAQANEKHAVLPFFDALNVGKLFMGMTEQALQPRAGYVNKTFYPFPDYTKEFLAFFSFPFHLYQTITLWHTDNASDKLMLYLLCWFFREQKIEVPLSEIHLNETEFLKRYHYGFCAFGLLAPEKMKVHIHDGQLLPKDSFLDYATLWNNWRKSDSTLRICKDGKVTAVSEGYLDKTIVSFCTVDFIKTTSVIGKCLVHIPYPIGDHFFHSRIQKLVRQGLLIANHDDLTDMRCYSVKVDVSHQYKK